MTATHHLHQLAAVAWHCGALELGRDACAQLLRRPLPPPQERIVRRNRTWYTQPLEDLAAVTFQRLDVDPAHPGWSTFNPTILATPAGFLAVVRSSNYAIVDGRYQIHNDDQTIRTTNLLVDLDDDFRPRSRREIRLDYQATAYPVAGLEDCRLNASADHLTLSGTIRNLAPLDGTCRIATATLDLETATAHGLTCPATPPGRHEKNWMPLVGDRRFLYASNDDGHVATATLEGDAWKITRGATAPHEARAYRGGGQLVPTPTPGLWLGLVHEVAVDDDGRRIYEHRFVSYSEPNGFAIAGTSPPFYFREHRAIEFAAGLARKGRRLVASFGVRDAEAWLVELELDQVLHTLTPATP